MHYRFYSGVGWSNLLAMEQLNLALQTYIQNVRQFQFLQRPSWKGHPSHELWERIIAIVQSNLSAFTSCHSLDELNEVFKALMQANGITNYTAKTVNEVCSQIAYYYDIPCDDSCYYMTSDNSVLTHIIKTTGVQALQLLSANSNTFQGLSDRDKIRFMLSNISLVRETCKQLQNTNNQNQ